MSSSTSSDPDRRTWLKAVAAGLIPVALGGALAVPQARQALARVLQPTPPLDGLRLSGPWLNSPPLDAAALRGKVVVVCFWTYSCINSLRVLPYLRAWQARYRDRGLVVIGVHTPEFRFERDPANVRQSVRDLDVGFPVVLDGDRRIWSAFGNNAWPAFHFFGADGRLYGHVDGEGGYDASERRIQALLSQTPGPVVASPLSTISGSGPEAAADWDSLGSGETYIGYGQADAFASPGGFRRDVEHLYRAPDRLALNRWRLTGGWTAGEEFAVGAVAGRIAHRFHARDLHMVLAPDTPERPVRYRVRIDGAPPGADHGWDVAPDGSGVVREPRMHQLVRQSRPVADRTFEIEFLDPGVRAYVFTFG
ncbi:redoxin domain-containing protein [Caulobacter hibisci]|uniref:Redoxin domain-containing protein n=1 Tax=Caulobacter hibisci TaxID=2035993 RepID=A0ABS0T7B1_9CAUL|nr:redoxin domain-containing protein [Caulobacter hibisci]MBI1686737.1 redoxin domain-containing protein [Caulobacter hibisci]